MVENPLPPPEEDPTLKWVHELNQLAGSMVETESSLHPSAWPEALRSEIAKYKRLAAEGPR